MIRLTTVADRHLAGVEGTIPPLVAGCAPFFARLVETALREVEHGLVEASWSMGGSTWQLIWRTLLPESRAGLDRRRDRDRPFCWSTTPRWRGDWRRRAAAIWRILFWLSALSDRRDGGHRPDAGLRWCSFCK